MIDKGDTRKDRRWLPSFSISGRLGSMRFDNLASAAAAVLVVAVILAPAVDAQTCLTVIQSQVDCLFAPASRANVITIDCLTAYYKASTTSATIYQAANSGAGCPSSAPVNTTAIGACFQSNAASCSSSSTSSTCFFAVTTPSSSASGACTGPYFVVTTYQCLPVPLTSNTTTSTATFMDYPNATSNVEVTIGNPSPVNNINFFGPTNYFCSIYVPAGLEVIVGYKFIIKSNPDCRWRIEISDVTNSPVAVFCNTTSPQRVSLGCGSDPTAPRYFALRYIGDNSTSIFFATIFQVRQENKVTVQCGIPPFPLYSTPPPATTTVAPTTPPATAPPTTTPPPPAVTTAAVAASTAAISTPTPSTPVFSTPAPASTNPPTAPVTTAAVAASTAAISTPTPSTTALPTPAPASTNPPAAPATSNAVTSGAPTTGGVTTAAPNPAVTTAQPNNIPTSALPLVSPTTASPPAAPDTSATANAITSGAVPSTSPTSLPSTSPTSPTSLRTISINGSVQTVTPSAGGVNSGWDMNATIGVVVGSVVAGAIVLAIVAAVALWRRSVIATATSAKAAAAAAASATNPPVTFIEPVTSTNYQLDAQAYNAGPYRNVTGFYVDGTSRSNLVISRPTPPPPPQPFKTVLRLQ